MSLRLCLPAGRRFERARHPASPHPPTLFEYVCVCRWHCPPKTKLGPEASEAVTSAAAVANPDATPSVEVPDTAAVAPSPSADPSTPILPSAASTSTALAPSSARPVLKKSWAFLLCPASGDSSTSKSSLPTSPVVDFPILVSPPPARVSPVRRAELVALLNGTTPTRYSALPRLRARGSRITEICAL